MSELMTPIPFRELMTWITTEYRRDGAVFGVHKPYKAPTPSWPRTSLPAISPAPGSSS